MTAELVQSIDEAKLLTADEVAAKLRICRAMAYRLIQNDEIPSIRVGKSVRVWEQDFLAFINRKLLESRHLPH